MSFPRAHYLIASSRLHPGFDGGYTITVLRRAQQFREHGGVTPHLLTFDLAADYETHRQGFHELGLADDGTVLRNLFDEARRDPTWLWGAADASPTAPASVAPDAPHTDHLGSDGTVLLRTPHVARPDWHRTDEPLTVFREGSPVGALAGFGGLYRAWVRHLIGQLDASLPVIIVAESRQIGELLRPLRDDRVRIVHTVHSMHTTPPHAWDSPVDTLWGGWLDTLDDYDAVVFPTPAQRDDVARRWRPRTRLDAIPHAVDPVTAPASDETAPNRIAMVGRLAPVKRIDHTIDAVAEVARRGIDIALDLYGEGPERDSLERVASDRGAADRVHFHGHVTDPTSRIAGATALVLTSTYEGMGVVIVEAFRAGVPVVAYDINYGPGDLIDGSNGILVPAGDITRLADALAGLTTDPTERARLSRGALATAERLSPASVMRTWAGLFVEILTPSQP